MNPNDEQARALDQAAFRKLKPMIDSTYPLNRFVAIYGGQVVADSPSFGEIHTKLKEIGIPPRQGLVVRAGVDYPEKAIILHAVQYENFLPCATP